MKTSSSSGLMTSTSERARLLDAALHIGYDLVPATGRLGGVDLYGGQSGIALFLGWLGRISGEDRFASIAKDAMHATLAAVADGSAGFDGIGAFNGWGSFVYALGQCARLWNDMAWLDSLRVAFAAIYDRYADDGRFDVVDGAAGAILALLSIDEIEPALGAAPLAVRCGEHLLRHASPHAAGQCWRRFPDDRAPSGLAHGAAGIALALARLGHVTGEQRFVIAAEAALFYEETLFDAAAWNWRANDGIEGGPTVSWCCGAPGVGLARAAMLPLHRPGPLRNLVRHDIQRALATTLEDGLAGGLSLCHGVVGNLVCAALMARALDDARAGERVVTLADRLLVGRARDKLHGRGRTPGLMSGLAGVGYGLLALAADEVPCLLLLDGAAAADGRPSR